MKAIDALVSSTRPPSSYSCPVRTAQQPIIQGLELLNQPREASRTRYALDALQTVQLLDFEGRNEQQEVPVMREIYT
jgi:hypothetical protein